MAQVGEPQIQVLEDSVRDRGEVDTDNETEQTPLLGHTHQRSAVGSRSRPRRSCCVKSKAAVAILLWVSLVSLLIGYVQHSILVTLFKAKSVAHFQEYMYVPLLYGLFALLYLFYPLAGCLADVKCGRYKTVIRSLWLMNGSVLLIIVGSAVPLYYWIKLGHVKPTAFVIGIVIAILIGITVLFSGYIPFNANIIQFGMDQLYDSPSEDSVLFVHWFTFISYTAQAIDETVVLVLSVTYPTLHPAHIRAPVFIAASLALPTLLLIVMCTFSITVHKYKRHWFMIDQASRNPYKLVYKVIKFAVQHKTPIRRSAFTYCEDELPSRMDLGKDKYGGPFTTEQVEDVKAFLGIMALLLTLGPILTTDIAGNNMLLKLYYHFFTAEQLSTYSQIPVYYLTTGGLSKIMIVISIPLYVCLLRPFIHRYVPSMLKRIGLGILIRLLSLLSITLIDSIGHVKSSNNKNCFMFYSPALSISTWYLTIPNVFNALSAMLFFIAVVEFMCAQSPHAMKGLIIGTFFAIQGTFQFLGATVLYIPFSFWSLDTSFPSCGFVYYLINILVTLSGLVAYTCVARRYQYRQRDEPDNVYRYAEEYYDRAIDERLRNNRSSYDA